MANSAAASSRVLPSAIARFGDDLTHLPDFTLLKDFADFDLNVLHIIGGGSLNQYLNQFTANSCGVTVLAGPQEGTAIGNIMLQAKASGLVKDIWEMRQIIANSLELKKLEPQDKEAWDAAYEKFLKVKG